jgi:conjugal transfer pilus assembly protein TraI
MGDIPRYPPFHEGLPAATPQQLLDTQEKLIRQIRHELALSAKDYDRMIPPLLESFAAFVHLLPASKSHHHRGAGGMLRHGLEVALVSTRRFHSRIIDGHETGERRKVLEPRWRLAVFVAGLTHDIGKAAYDLSVTDIHGRLTWDVYTQNLHEFLGANKLERYFVGWRKNREHKVHERFSHLLTMRVVPNTVFSWLNEGDPKIISAIHETISGSRPKGSARVMYDLVMEADQLSVSQDIKGQRIADGDESLAVPVPKYILDAIKRLIEDDQWQANKTGQPLWVTSRGVFLDWNKAVPDIVRMLDRDGARGIPKSKSSIAESLADYDVIKTHETEDGNNSYYLTIAPEALEKGGKLERILVVEVNGLDVLFDGPHPAPVKAYLGETQIVAREEAMLEEKGKAQDERKNENTKFKDKMAKKGVNLPVIAEDESAPDAADTPVEPHDEAGTPPIIDSPATKPKPAPIERPAPRKASVTDTKEKAPVDLSWLENYGEMGVVLRECFIPGKGSKAIFQDGDMLLPYPNGMDCYGDAKTNKLNLIKSLLHFDPMTPNKAVHKVKVRGQIQSVLMIRGDLARSLAGLVVDEPKNTNTVATGNPTKPVASVPKTNKTPAKQTTPEKASASNEDEVTTPRPTEPKTPAKSRLIKSKKGAQPDPEATAMKADPVAEREKAPAAPKATPKPLKTAAKKPASRKKPVKDTPPPMPAGPKKTAGTSAGKTAVTQLIECFQKTIPDVETINDEAGVWANQLQVVEWFRESVNPSVSHSALMTGFLAESTQMKEINKETFMFIPFQRDSDHV